MPLAYLNLSSLANAYCPASFGRSLWGEPGFKFALTVFAAALPKITISSKELAPSLFAP